MVLISPFLCRSLDEPSGGLKPCLTAWKPRLGLGRSAPGPVKRAKALLEAIEVPVGAGQERARPPAPLSGLKPYLRP